MCTKLRVLSARFLNSRDGIRCSVWNGPVQSGDVRISGAQYTRGGIQSFRRSMPPGMVRMDQTAFPDVHVYTTSSRLNSTDTGTCNIHDYNNRIQLVL